MNPVVRAQLKSFSDENPSIELDSSELFEVFSMYSVLNGLLSESIDPFKAHLQSNEFGIDGIAITIQGDLCCDADDAAEALSHGSRHEICFNLFQSKTSENLDYGNMSKFFDGAFQFFTDDFHSPSEQLQELSDVKDKIYSSNLKTNPFLRLYYMTTGTNQVSEQIKKLIDAAQARFADLNIFDRIDIVTVGAKLLQDGYRSATNSISQAIEFRNPLTLPEHPDVQQAFIGLIRAEELVKLISLKSGETDSSKVNRAVFFDNVRDFDESSEINQSILHELQTGNQPSFVFKNNGVTAVAKEVSRKGDEFLLDDYQIVNGCQTCNILHAAGDDAISGVFVPFRLIESRNPDFISTVIIGTNKQNQVKDDQFWALKPFMKDLEEYARQQDPDRQIFLERREHQYRGEQVERTRIIKPSELVKAIAALFLFQPHRAARDYRGIRKDFSEVLFRDDHLVVPYYTAAYAVYRLEFAIRNKRVPREWAIYKYYVLSMIGNEATAGMEVFSLSRAKQEAICRTILEIVSDDEKLVESFTRAAKILDEEVIAADLDTREKVRDFIRSETVAGIFKQKAT